MALFPFLYTAPLVSQVDPPEKIYPLHRFVTDSGVEIRRAKHSRMRRRYSMAWKHLTAGDLHLIDDFLGTCGFGAVPFEFLHPTAVDDVNILATTPVTLNYAAAHGLLTGQWVGVMSSPANALNGYWPISRLNALQLTLTGSTPQGAGMGTVRVYLPQAVAIFADDTMESPTTLRGPEAGVQGFFQKTLTIEELL